MNSTKDTKHITCVMPQRFNFGKAVLLLVLALLASHAQGQSGNTITITATGTVSGTDCLGLFVPTNTPNCTVSNQAYTWTFTVSSAQSNPNDSCDAEWESGNVVGSCASSMYTYATATGTLTAGNGTITITAGQYAYFNAYCGANYYPQNLLQCYQEVSFVFPPTSGEYVSMGPTFQIPTTQPVNFDWRSAMGIGGIPVSGTFSASTGVPYAINVSGPANITESGFNCSVTPTLSIDTGPVTEGQQTGGQPNLLISGDSTTPAISIEDAATWYPITLSYSSYVATGPPAQLASNPIQLATDTSGDVSFTYEYTSTGTPGDAQTVNDKITASACSTASPPLTVYDYNASLGNNTLFNIHTSQVSDTTYTTPTDLDASQIQTFLTNVPNKDGGTGSFLAAFYLDTNGNGGWMLPAITGKATNTYNGTDAEYCVSATACPAEGDKGQYAATIIAKAATNSTHSINPKLLLVKLQTENGLVNTPIPSPPTTLPVSAGTLNNGMGCENASDQTFADQLNCAAATFWNKYNKATEPYFWPVKPGVPIAQNAQYAYASAANCRGKKPITPPKGCALVAFEMETKATVAQYNYTPFVQTQTAFGGGGVKGFETLWYQYDSNDWYQGGVTVTHKTQHPEKATFSPPFGGGDVESSDGRLLAHFGHEYPPVLYIRNLNTGEDYAIAKSPEGPAAWASVSRFEFSPDGSRVIFEAAPPRQFTGDIYSVKTDGSEVDILASDELSDDSGSSDKQQADLSIADPRYSPDGKQIVVQVSVTEGLRDAEGRIIHNGDKSYVGLLSAVGEGQTPRRLVEGVPQFWNEDGTSVYYTKGPDAKDSGMYRVVLATKHSERVADLRDFYLLGRVPGTNSVLVERRDTKTLIVVSLDGTPVSPAVNTLAATIPVMDSEGRYLHKIEEAGPHRLSVTYLDATQSEEHVELVSF